MRPKTTGYVERGVLGAFVTWALSHERYQRDELPTSTIQMRLNNQTGQYGRGDVADSSVRRAMGKLRDNDLITTVPREELSEAQLESHPREKFWQLTPAGFFEVLLIHQAFNDELKELYRRFGSTDWGHTPGDALDVRNLRTLDRDEIQSIAKQLDVPANQSTEDMAEQILSKVS